MPSFFFQDEGERNATVPSNRQEKEWFVQDSPAVSNLEDLKDTRVTRKKKPGKLKVGDEIVYEEISEAAKNLAAATTGLPEFAADYFNVATSGLPKVRMCRMKSKLQSDLKRGFHLLRSRQLTLTKPSARPLLPARGSVILRKWELKRTRLPRRRRANRQLVETSLLWGLPARPDPGLPAKLDLWARLHLPSELPANLLNLRRVRKNVFAATRPNSSSAIQISLKPALQLELKHPPTITPAKQFN